MYQSSLSPPLTLTPLSVVETGCDVCMLIQEQHISSKRNHSTRAVESTAQNIATAKVWQALEYVRLKRPRVVVVENVAEASVYDASWVFGSL